MLKMQIINTVKIEPLNEEYIRNLIIADIQKQDANVHVTGIDFIQRRNPTCIEAEITAQYGKPAPQVEATESDADKQEELPITEPEESSPFVDDEEDAAEEETSAPTTVSDLFKD